MRPLAAHLFFHPISISPPFAFSVVRVFHYHCPSGQRRISLGLARQYRCAACFAPHLYQGGRRIRLPPAPPAARVSGHPPHPPIVCLFFRAQHPCLYPRPRGGLFSASLARSTAARMRFGAPVHAPAPLQHALRTDPPLRLVFLLLLYSLLMPRCAMLGSRSSPMNL